MSGLEKSPGAQRWIGKTPEPPSEAGRILAQKIGGGIAGTGSRRALIGVISIRLADLLDLTRTAFRLEADDDGEFAPMIVNVQESIRDAMAGCQATLLGMAEREQKAVPAAKNGHGQNTENPARR